jgi:hypothetical protein
VIEAMYIDARIISKPGSRAGGDIEPGFGVQQFDSEWLKNPFEKPNVLAQLGPLNRLASLHGPRWFERRASSSSEIDVGSVSSTDHDGGKRRGATRRRRSRRWARLTSRGVVFGAPCGINATHPGIMRVDDRCPGCPWAMSRG